MALFKTGKFLMKRIYANETVVNEIMKQNIPISMLVDKYLSQLREVNYNKIDLLNFPTRTFYKFQKHIMKDIITETYKYVKTKSYQCPALYDNVMKSYMYYKIDFDIRDLREEMAKHRVQYNEKIYNNFIKYYSNKGEMCEVENLLDEMKKKNVQLSMTHKFIIASGYIIAGQPEKAESFSKDYKLDMECSDMFYSRCLGYASIGCVASVRNILDEMKEKNVIFSPKEYFILYYKLICRGVDDSNLMEMIDLTKTHLVNASNQLYVLIIILNAADHFRHSMILIEKLIDLIENPAKFIESFTTSRCSMNILKQVYALLMPLCGNISYEKSIFGDLNYDTALNICRVFSKSPNWKLIHFSLLSKAISERSLLFIDNALQFSSINLHWWQINLLIQQIFIPLLLDIKIVSNYKEILESFPAFRNHILPVILMKYLCSGDFQCYNELIPKQKFMKKMIITLDWDTAVTDLRFNLTMKEIDKWLIEAGKYFDAQVINSVLSQLLIDDILKLSNNKSPAKELEKIIGYAKKWNVEFSQATINNLIDANPTHFDLIRCSIEKGASAS